MRPVLAAIPPGVTSLINKAGGGKFLFLAINSPKPPCSGRSSSTSVVSYEKGNVVTKKEAACIWKVFVSYCLFAARIRNGRSGLHSQCPFSTRIIDLFWQQEIMPEVQVSCNEEVLLTVGTM